MANFYLTNKAIKDLNGIWNYHLTIGRKNKRKNITKCSWTVVGMQSKIQAWVKIKMK